MKKRIVLTSSILAVLTVFSLIIWAQPQQTTPSESQNDSKNQGEIEKFRQELLKKWGTDELVQPKQVAAKAKALFSRPLEEQTIKELEEVADKANRAANFIGFIQEQYAEYYRDNYRYDFILSKVTPSHDGYVRASNQYKDYRNQAFFNLGLKYKNAGNTRVAFFYFYDAFRLSNFTEENDNHKGMRYYAEQEMKQLLGMNELESFIYWKTESIK